MTIMREDELGERLDEAVLTLDEHVVAMQQVLYALLNRVAQRAENPFDELQTIRRLIRQDLDVACRMHDGPVRIDSVADEADRYIRVTESRIM